MRPIYDWYSLLNIALYSLLYLAALFVSWLGWTRQRRLGFLVLCAWAVTMIGNLFLSGFIATAVQKAFGSLFSAQNTSNIFRLTYMATHTVTMLILLAGLALLVFRDQPLPRAGDTTTSPSSP